MITNRTNTVSDLSNTGPAVANMAWYAMERASKSSMELQQDLRQFVRNTLFPAQKMITGAEQMAYSESAHSICQFACVWWNARRTSLPCGVVGDEQEVCPPDPKQTQDRCWWAREDQIHRYVHTRPIKPSSNPS